MLGLHRVTDAALWGLCPSLTDDMGPVFTAVPSSLVTSIACTDPEKLFNAELL
jgi:hypothetical protein